MNAARAFALATCARAARRRRRARRTWRHPAQASTSSNARSGRRRRAPAHRGPRRPASRDLARRRRTGRRSSRAFARHRGEDRQWQRRPRRLAARRTALTRSRRTAPNSALLRAAYAIGDDAPLKLMLAQDKVADANRLLAYHGYSAARTRAQDLRAGRRTRRSVAGRSADRGHAPGPRRRAQPPGRAAGRGEPRPQPARGAGRATSTRRCRTSAGANRRSGATRRR